MRTKNDHPQFMNVVLYVIEKIGPLPSNKLHKIMYYINAWHLAIRDESAFIGDFETWRIGPILVKLYKYTCGKIVDKKDMKYGKIDLLSDETKDIIDKVIDIYGKKSDSELLNIVQTELPWKKANVKMNINNEVPILSKKDIIEYYSSLYIQNGRVLDDRVILQANKRLI